MRQIRRQSLKPSGVYERISAKGLFAMLDTRLCEPGEFRAFIERIDERMGAGEVIKDVNDSRSTYVARLRLGGRDVMVKRYNHKGLAHSFGRTLQGSRARHNWLVLHALERMAVPSAQPLAFVEIRRGPLVWKSYVLCEFIDARSLREALESGPTSENELADIAAKVHALLKLIGERRIIHGDLKLENILLADEQAVLVDLDQMRIHRSGLLHRIRRDKDLATFRWHLSRYPRFETFFDSVEKGRL